MTGYNMEKTRCFIAINLPEDIKSYLKGVLENLKKVNPQGIKWVNPDGLHITLHFLGFCDLDLLQEASKIIEKEIKSIASDKAEKILELKDLGVFPNLNLPRVVLLNTDELNGDYFHQIRKKMSMDLERAGIRIDYRPWQPHITLGRRNFVDENVPVVLKDIKIENLNFKVKSIELMKSELMPSGSKYSIIKSFPICE